MARHFEHLGVTQLDWFGVPFSKRYSEVKAEPHVLKAIKNYDKQLDLKFYMPTEKWHLIRYLGSIGEKFTRVWELDDRPDLGLRKEPGMWMVDALRMADMQGAARNRVEEIDEHNASIEKANKREVHEQCKELSKDMLKPLQNWAELGANSETHLNYQVKADLEKTDAPR
jgi:hypothetical protein